MIYGAAGSHRIVVDFLNYEGEIPFTPYKGNIRELAARNIK